MLRCPPPALVKITPTGPLRATVRPPGSTEISNRALLCAAMAEGESELVGASNNEETQVVVDGLRRLGIPIEISKSGTRWEIQGCGGRIPVSQADLNVPDDDATMAFLAAATSLGRGSYRFGRTRWGRDRSLLELQATFRQLGVEARCENQPGRSNLLVRGRGLNGGRAAIGNDVSSHLFSGLLLVAPCARRNVQVRFADCHAFHRQILLTFAVMRAFDVAVPVGRDLRQIDVGAPQTYRGRRYEIEPDASAAGCFWAAAAITRGIVTVEGLSLDALQSEVELCSCLRRMGCRVDYGPHSITVAGNRLKGIEVNARSVGDNLPALAAVSLFAEGPTTITGLANGGSPETDRMVDLACELRKLGASIEKTDKGLQIIPRAITGAEIDSHDDHRLAMSLALVGLRIPGVAIRDPECTESAYPRFFEELMALGD